MKTAVSIPDDLFDKAEKTARKLGIARSQLYARALEEFINRHDKDRITRRLNAVLEKQDNPPGNSAADAGLESLRSSLKHDTW